MHTPTPPPNGIFVTEDGSHSIFSSQFGFSYHSKYGAIQETQHVFIDAALAFKADTQTEISILDIGFGTGLNAYMTALEAEKRKLRVNYVGVEKFPISEDQALQLNYPQLLIVDATPFQQLHTSKWNEKHSLNEHFSYTKLLLDFHKIDFINAFDIIYFDAFAPAAQPHLWDIPLLEKMYQALKKNGVLTTYCAKGVVKRRLKSVGFTVEALKGPPGKREMTRALKLS